MMGALTASSYAARRGPSTGRPGLATLAFQQVDVFTAEPFKGNPVAVVLEGDRLSTEQMQAVARWTNLSETTFVCAPTDRNADYRLRIFTPRSELPFAGHPTIGSAHAALRHGLKPRAEGCLVQECGKGLVRIAVEGELLLLALPTPQFCEASHAQIAWLADALAVESSSIERAAIVDVGPVWFTVQLASAEAVLALQPDLDKLLTSPPKGLTGVTVFGLNGLPAETDLEVRSFAPAEGVPEDPVCGSGNGCVAALVRREALMPRRSYVASQGRCLGRDGRVTIRFDDDGAIWLGGHCVTCVEGSLIV
jgi:PhzF family phenazine biosynthesis protein